MHRSYFFIALAFIISFPSFAQQPVLYGHNNTGGANDYGTIFEYNIQKDQFTLIKHLDMSDGIYPIGSMIMASNGRMYGLLNSGGANDAGVIYELDPATNTFTKKIDLVDSLGRYPWGPFTEYTDGKLYALVNAGGIDNKGTIVAYDPTANAISKVFDIGSNTAGARFPSRNNLAIGPNGLFYMAMRFGGVADGGMLATFDPSTKTLSVKKQFSREGVYYPHGPLTLANNGKFYGTLNYGGNNSFGAIYEFDPSNDSLAILLHLDSANFGAYPTAGFMLARNGNLYGFTNSGGADGVGTLLELDPVSGQIVKKADLDYDMIGGYSWGELVEVEDGMFYIAMNSGGVNNVGTIISYNLSTNTFTKLYDLSYNSTGGFPHGKMVLVNGPTSTFEPKVRLQMQAIPNPASGQVTFHIPDQIIDGSLAVFSSAGQLITQIALSQHNPQVSVAIASWPAGIYQVHCTGKEYSATTSFTKM